MKESMIKVLKMEIGRPPQVKEIRNELASLQAEVEGLIECVYLEDGCLAIVNEEGKINGMAPNRRLGNDIICGPFFICGDTPDGELTSLNENDIRRYTQRFADVPTFTGDEPELKPQVTIIGFDN